MSSPELQFDAFDLPENGPDTLPAHGTAAALKQQVADRLSAHRSRRNRQAKPNLIAVPKLDPEPAAKFSTKSEARPETRQASKSAANPLARPAKSRANRIAAAVAERYAQSTTYREFLAAEAERAIAEANATAEIAARNAEAVTAVQQQLLAELDLWDTAPCPEPTVLPAVPAPDSSQLNRDELGAKNSLPPPSMEQAAHPLTSGLTVRLYEDVGPRQPAPRIAYAPASHVREPKDHETLDHLNHLDEEIAFRQAPVFDAPATPPEPIPANLIHFPRQLVAARKSRPRLAEGPLREEADAAPTAAQLRIFEVEASQFSSAPTAGPETSLPEWSSIHLDATPVVLPAVHAQADPVRGSEAQLQTQLYVPIQVAPLGDRLMAAAVDACLLGATFLAAVCAFAYAVKSLPTGPVALIASAATLLVLYVLYQMLFFTFACATPGMKYARIGLCTFSDDNPTRAEMRRRVWFVLLAACPLGLGVLWSLLDEDTLGWHDRLSRIYQRSY